MPGNLTRNFQCEMLREIRASCGTAGRAGDCDTFGDFCVLGRAIDRPRAMAGEGVTAMIVAADAGDDPR